MRTIFITLFQGVEAKNLLRTGVVADILKTSDIRVVLFVGSKERAEYYRKEFSDPRIIYEVAEYVSSGFLDRLLGRLKFQTLQTKTTDLRRRMRREVSGNYLAYWLGIFINRMLAHRLVRKILRRFDFAFVGGATYARFFDQYRPDAVLLAHLFDDNEIAILREAKRRGVRTIGFINSWDKLTGRCSIRILPDELLVFNEIVKKEAMRHADMPEAHIHMVGIPQYDIYANYKPSPREIFMKKIGIEPSKRFILYAPMGETFSSSDWAVLDLLHQWVLERKFPKDVNFFVRFQPNDLVSEDELARRPWLRFDRPGTRFTKTRGVDWDMTGDEMSHLADTLSYAELLVCYASSMSIDAAVFGRPVININFEVKQLRHLIKSPTQFYQMEHYRNAIRTGGLRLVESQEELLQWINRYLGDPSLDQEGRLRMLKEQCGIMDGRAAMRIADAVLGK